MQGLVPNPWPNIDSPLHGAWMIRAAKCCSLLLTLVQGLSRLNPMAHRNGTPSLFPAVTGAGRRQGLHRVRDRVREGCCSVAPVPSHLSLIHNSYLLIVLFYTFAASALPAGNMSRTDSIFLPSPLV